jgi:hypothetical protein
MTVSDTSPNPDLGFIGVGDVYFKKVGETFWRDMGESPKFSFTPTVASIDWMSHRRGLGKTRIKAIVTEQTGAVAIQLQEGSSKNWELALMTGSGVSVNISAAAFTTSSGGTLLSLISPTALLTPGRRYGISGGFVRPGETFVYSGGVANSGVGTLDGPAISGGATSGSITLPGGQVDTKAMTVFSESQIEGSLLFVGKNEAGVPVMLEYGNIAFKPSGAVEMINDAALGELPLTAECSLDAYGNFAQAYWNIAPDFVPYLGP